MVRRSSTTPPEGVAALTSALTWLSTMAPSASSTSSPSAGPSTRRSAPRTPVAVTMEESDIGVPIKSWENKVGGTGVHKDKTLREVATTNPDWVKWVLKSTPTVRSSWGGEMKANHQTFSYYFALENDVLIRIRAEPGMAPSTSSASYCPQTPQIYCPQSPQTPDHQQPTPTNAAQAILLITSLSTSDLEMLALQMTHEQPPGYERAVRALELIFFLQ